MSELAVRQDTVWSDPKEMAPFTRWTVNTSDHDCRIGGRRRMTFGSPTEQFEDSRYEEIISGGRLCYAMTIALGDTRTTTSMVTFEINPQGAGSEMIVTDQLAILEGGWGETLPKLTAVLRS